MNHPESLPIRLPSAQGGESACDHRIKGGVLVEPSGQLVCDLRNRGADRKFGRKLFNLADQNPQRSRPLVGQHLARRLGRDVRIPVAVTADPTAESNRNPVGQ